MQGNFLSPLSLCNIGLNKQRLVNTIQESNSSKEGTILKTTHSFPVVIQFLFGIVHCVCLNQFSLLTGDARKQERMEKNKNKKKMRYYKYTSNVILVWPFETDSTSLAPVASRMVGEMINQTTGYVCCDVTWLSNYTHYGQEPIVSLLRNNRARRTRKCARKSCLPHGYRRYTKQASPNIMPYSNNFFKNKQDTPLFTDHVANFAACYQLPYKSLFSFFEFIMIKIGTEERPLRHSIATPMI